MHASGLQQAPEQLFLHSVFSTALLSPAESARKAAMGLKASPQQRYTSSPLCPDLIQKRATAQMSGGVRLCLASDILCSRLGEMVKDPTESATGWDGSVLNPHGRKSESFHGDIRSISADLTCTLCVWNLSDNVDSCGLRPFEFTDGPFATSFRGQVMRAVGLHHRRAVLRRHAGRREPSAGEEAGEAEAQGPLLQAY